MIMQPNVYNVILIIIFLWTQGRKNVGNVKVLARHAMFGRQYVQHAILQLVVNSILAQVSVFVRLDIQKLMGFALIVQELSSIVILVIYLNVFHVILDIL